MGKIIENGHSVITYEENLRDIHWAKLSNYLQQRYIKENFADKNLTEIILKDAFSYLVQAFKEIIHKESHFLFFSYVFRLHEESIKLYFKTLDGYSLKNISEFEFSKYRRILKLILEEGCEINMDWGNTSFEEFKRIEFVIENLIYIGTWMYELSENISYNKMIKNCYTINVKDNYFGVIWNYHFGWTYETIKQKIMPGQYEAAICDKNASKELMNKLKEIYGFHVGDFFFLIREIQKRHNPIDPNAQTIEPYVLPLNLINIVNKPKSLIESFCNGLIINRNNKPSIETSIYKPTDKNRYAFRPIIVYNIDGVERALIGENKINETFQMLTTNGLHWKGLPDEWIRNEDMKEFMNQKNLKHESLYIDKIKHLIKNVNCYVDYNIENLLKNNNQNKNILKDPGEIDCIIIIPKYRRIIVSDIKYNRARFEAVGWQKDFVNFVNIYEYKLRKKTEWIKNNREELQEHFEVKFDMKDIKLDQYSVEGCFFLNTPTFYMFNGNYRAITIKDMPKFFEGWLGDVIVNPDNLSEKINHPYFKMQ